MKSLDQCTLYAFVDMAYLRGRSPAAVARQLCEGGADLIQLRAKGATQDEILRIAQEIIPNTRAANVGLVINDHVAIARAIGGEVCHLGQEDFVQIGHPHIAELKKPGEPLLIGLSTHAPEQALRAVEAGADYIAIGPIFATPTKPTASPVTLDYVRWAAEHLQVPWFAIGGINLENVDSVLDAGATRICVVSAILNATDVAEACRQFKRKLQR